MSYFFTSDYHLGHANIIKYSNRPFKNLNEMNEVIIANHNERVKPEDTVYFLGDFCFRNTKGGKKGEGETTRAEEYLSRLNGRFVFIQGNHDHNNGVKSVLLSGTIELGGQTMFMVHNPADMDPTFGINLCGHVHEKWKMKKDDRYPRSTLINVGVDMWGYRPININEILQEHKRWLKSEKIIKPGKTTKKPKKSKKMKAIKPSKSSS